MKTLIKILTVLLLLNLSTGLTSQKASAQVGISFQIFYDNLSPYGNWVMNPSYGYVWVPGVGAGFSPYATGGHWVFTEYGWTWVSNYAWGWAPFHYGRWYFDPMYGWIWVPGNVWAPAWVAWYGAPGYYGWTPLQPGWDVNYVIAGRYNIPHEHWVFVPDRYIDRPDLEHYYGPRGDNQKIMGNSTVINRTYEDNSTHDKYFSGPDRNDVQQKTGKQIQPVQVRAYDKPGQKLSGGELAIYRPHVQNTNVNGEKPAPKKVVPMNEVKPVNERSDVNTEHKATSPKKAENKKAAPADNATPSNNEQPPAKSGEKQTTPEKKKQEKNPAPSHDKNPKNNDVKEQPEPPRSANQSSRNGVRQQYDAKSNVTTVMLPVSTKQGSHNSVVSQPRSTQPAHKSDAQRERREQKNKTIK